MVTKADYLKKLSTDQLKEIAKAEGIRVPKGARKSTIINKLLVLSMRKIKSYIHEYTEEIERTTIIKERIRRRGKITKREKTEVEVKFSKAEIVYELLKENIRLHKSLIEKLGEKYRFHPKLRGGWHRIYDSFNEDALKVVHECFIEKKLDRKGRYLEYRVAQWLTRANKAIDKIEIDKKIPGIGEIDVVGYDKNGNIICIAECKARRQKATKEEIDPWLRNVELIFNETKGTLKKAYFVNVAGFTDGIKKRMLEDKRINKKGFFLLKKSLFKITEDAIVIGHKEGVNIFLCEERAGKIKQVFP